MCSHVLTMLCQLIVVLGKAKKPKRQEAKNVGRNPKEMNVTKKLKNVIKKRKNGSLFCMVYVFNVNACIGWEFLCLCRCIC